MRLKRLKHVYIKDPFYFITLVTEERIPILLNEYIHEIFKREWEASAKLRYWHVGRFVIMPDHLHFICWQSNGSVSLGKFLQYWKQFTTKEIKKLYPEYSKIWQDNLHDRLIRDADEFDGFELYMKDNPIKAGLVSDYDVWPYEGQIEFYPFEQQSVK